MKSLSLICTTSNLTTIYSPKRFMEDLAVITALNHSGSLERISLCLRKKGKNVIHPPRSYWEKQCPRSWVRYGPLSWRKTYIYYTKEFLVRFAESFPVTGWTLVLIDSNYTASEKCFMSTKPPSTYQSLYIYYIWKLVKTKIQWTKIKLLPYNIS